MLAAEDPPLVFRLLELGFAAKDKVPATHDPIVGQPACPIEDRDSVLVLSARVFAKIDDVFLASFALRGYNETNRVVIVKTYLHHVEIV